MKKVDFKMITEPLAEFSRMLDFDYILIMADDGEKDFVAFSSRTNKRIERIKEAAPFYINEMVKKHNNEIAKTKR